MAIVKSYTNAQRALTSLRDRVEKSLQVAILLRRGNKNLVDAKETAHLKRSATTALHVRSGPQPTCCTSPTAILSRRLLGLRNILAKPNLKRDELLREDSASN